MDGQVSNALGAAMSMLRRPKSRPERLYCLNWGSLVLMS